MPGPACGVILGRRDADRPACGGHGWSSRRVNGAEEDRTPNLGIANAALSQLSYRPEPDAAKRGFSSGKH